MTHEHMQVLLGFLSVCLILASRGVYFFSIYKGKTKPHAFSWLIWGLLSAIGFAAQVVEGAGPGSWARGFGMVASFIIVGIALKYGERNFTRGDKITLAVALAAIPLWAITNTPVWSVILVCVIDTIGYLPTLRKSWARPDQEPAFGYGLSACCAALSLLAIEHYTLSTWLYSAVLMTSNLCMVSFLLLRRMQLRPLKTATAAFFALIFLAGTPSFAAPPAVMGNNGEARTAGALLPADRAVPADIRNLKAAIIEVYKSERRMDLLDAQGNPIRSYMVSLGKNPVGDKQTEGDGKTPEGQYFINGRNENSSYYLSLRISYPNKNDLWRADKNRVKPGGSIFIHGLPNGQGWKSWKYNKHKDWTNGCIAVYNNEIREIWNLVDDGTPIVIRP